MSRWNDNLDTVQKEQPESENISQLGGLIKDFFQYQGEYEQKFKDRINKMLKKLNIKERQTLTSQLIVNCILDASLFEGTKGGVLWKVL